MGSTENAKRSEGEVFFQLLLWLRTRRQKSHTHIPRHVMHMHAHTHTPHYIIYLALLQSIYMNFSVYFHDQAKIFRTNAVQSVIDESERKAFLRYQTFFLNQEQYIFQVFVFCFVFEHFIERSLIHGEECTKPKNKHLCNHHPSRETEQARPFPNHNFFSPRENHYPDFMTHLRFPI